MFLKDEDYAIIYDMLNKDDTVDIESKLKNIFKKYEDRINISSVCFVEKLSAIWNSLDDLQDGNEDVTEKFIRESNRSEKYNFEKMTFPLFAFTKNLYYDLLAVGASRVYFLSREGQFMKKLFDTFQEKIAGPKIETEYLCVSRASTFLGTLRDISEEDFSGLFNQYPNLSLETFCKNLNFSQDEIDEVEASFEYNMKIARENLKSTREFKLFIKNKKFLSLYDKKRNDAKSLFLKYLKQFGDDYLDKMYIVDVGWKGTIQDNIQKMLDEGEVIGYYLGLVNYAEINGYANKKAVLFENTLNRKTINGYLYNSNRSIFEMLLAANHGSTSSYKIVSGKVEPNFHEEEKERVLYTEKVKPIQDNIFEKFLVLVDILKSPNYKDTVIEKIINNKFFELMFSPSESEVSEYESFYHFENFGVMNYSYFNSENRVTLMKKVKNYLRFGSFIANDDTWQYLKLYRCNMKLGIFILYNYKKLKFKKMDVI